MSGLEPSFFYLQAVCPYMMDLAPLCLHKIGIQLPTSQGLQED